MAVFSLSASFPTTLMGEPLCVEKETEKTWRVLAPAVAACLQQTLTAIETVFAFITTFPAWR
jgi:hypothetical protein